MNELLSPKQLEQSRVVREEELKIFLCSMFRSAKKKEVVNVGVEIMKLTNNIVCRMAIGTRCSDKTTEPRRLGSWWQMLLNLGQRRESVGAPKKSGFLVIEWTIDVVMRFDQLLEKILKHHEEQSGKRENGDLMDTLLKVYEDDKAEVKMTRINIKTLLVVSYCIVFNSLIFFLDSRKYGIKS